MVIRIDFFYFEIFRIRGGRNIFFLSHAFHENELSTVIQKYLKMISNKLIIIIILSHQNKIYYSLSSFFLLSFSQLNVVVETFSKIVVAPICSNVCGRASARICIEISVKSISRKFSWNWFHHHAPRRSSRERARKARSRAHPSQQAIISITNNEQ